MHQFHWTLFPLYGELWNNGSRIHKPTYNSVSHPDFAGAIQDNILLLWGLLRHKSTRSVLLMSCLWSKVRGDSVMLGTLFDWAWKVFLTGCQHDFKRMGFHIRALTPVELSSSPPELGFHYKIPPCQFSTTCCFKFENLLRRPKVENGPN